ncbi:hypothetical protein [Neobacillus fumarioli]|uniref:hypothetical protein n=1 Tax=Neobacillus fumarioli TaxID=105229 RepID=UPI00082A3DED|nr:hypothetical protein [Neobacillus fumarioli]
MKINEYYRNAAYINLNGSLAALFPAATIMLANLFMFKNQKIMFLTIPFFLYSFFCFQLYLFKMKQSILISRNMCSRKEGNGHHSLFAARELLVFFVNTSSPKVLFYFPDGYLAGSISKYKGERNFDRKTFVLQNCHEKVLGFFRVRRKQNIIIEVFDEKKNYLGYFEKQRKRFRKSKKELLDPAGRYIGAVEGSSIFMDEKVFTQENRPIGRLRRGWMPLEWSELFPEPNTPVLSFTEVMSEKDKLLRMSFIVNEYFIER